MIDYSDFNSCDMDNKIQMITESSCETRDDSLIDFSGFVDNMNTTIVQYMSKHTDDIHNIYKEIKDKGYSLPFVESYDINCTIVNYIDYNRTMLDYINDYIKKNLDDDSKLDISFNDMLVKDSEFFNNSLGDKVYESVSDCMKNVECIVKLQPLLTDYYTRAKSIYEIGNSEAVTKLLCLYTKSVEFFMTHVWAHIVSSLETIIDAINKPVVMHDNTLKFI